MNMLRPSLLSAALLSAQPALADSPGFGASAGASAATPAAEMALAYWAVLDDPSTDLAALALQQLRLQLALPQAQRWPVAVALLQAGALQSLRASDWPRPVRREVGMLADQLDRVLSEVEEGPELLRLGVTSELTGTDWSDGVRLTLSDARRLRLAGGDDCGASLAWLTRDANGAVSGAGLLAMEDGQALLIPPGTLTLRPFGSACTELPQLALSAPPAALPVEGLALTTYAVDLAQGERLRRSIPNQAGKAYHVETTALGHGVDTVLAVLDGGGRVLDEDDDGGDGLASRMHWFGDGSERQLELATLDDAGGAFELQIREVAYLPLPVPGQLSGVTEVDGSWYRLDASVAGRYRVHMSGEDIDPALIAFSSGGAGPMMVNDDMAPGTLDAQLELLLGAGEAVWIVAGSRQAEGEFALDVSLTEAKAGGDIPPVTDLAQLAVRLPAVDGVLALNAAAGEVLAIQARADQLQVHADQPIRLLGEHVAGIEAPSSEDGWRTTVSCWQMGAAGQIQISLRDADALPVAVGRVQPGSGLCPSRPSGPVAMEVLQATSLAALSPVLAWERATPVRIVPGQDSHYLRLPRLGAEVPDSIDLRARGLGALTLPAGLQVSIVDPDSGTSLSQVSGCGTTPDALVADTEYLLRIDGAVAVEQELLIEVRPLRAHLGLKVGDEVVIHRHYLREGELNWAAGMEAHVGKRAIVRALVEDSGAEQLVRLDIDDGNYVWRAESLRPLGI